MGGNAHALFKKLTVDLGIILEDNGLHQLEIDMTTYEVTLNKARNAYIKYVLYSSLDRDEIQAEMLRSFDSDVVEEAIADVESELEELN